jgi:hypothetical protein
MASGAGNEPNAGPDWFDPALDALAGLGPTSEALADFVVKRRVRLGFTPQRHSSATWFNWRRLRSGVYLDTHYAIQRPDAPHISALVAHEVKHLQQGFWEALSVRGELVAWQVQHDVLGRLSCASSDPRWDGIAILRPDSRSDLVLARALMKTIGGARYHIELFPLWPLREEISFQLRRLTLRLCLALRCCLESGRAHRGGEEQ